MSVLSTSLFSIRFRVVTIERTLRVDWRSSFSFIYVWNPHQVALLAYIVSLRMAFTLLCRKFIASAAPQYRISSQLRVLVRTNYWDALKEWQEPQRIGEDIEVLRRRLLYQSKQRGFKENDMLVGAFAEKCVAYQASLLMQQIYW